MKECCIEALQAVRQRILQLEPQTRLGIGTMAAQHMMRQRAADTMASPAERQEQAEQLRTPEQWAAQLGVEIRDPDGWRGKDAPDFKAPCTLSDFEARLAHSTIRSMVLSEGRCKKCAGTGDKFDVATMDWAFPREPCPACQGHGEVIEQ